MYQKYSIFHVIFIAVTLLSRAHSKEKGRHKYGHPDKSLWKKEYENELTDAMLSSRQRENITRVTQSAGMSDNEVVIEKLMDTITSSEKYLKKVDSIDFRLNRLDIEIHEKTNSILKLLTEIMKTVHDDTHTDKLGMALDSLRNDMNDVKLIMERNQRTNNNPVEGSNFSVDASLDSRLTFLENHIKTIMNGVESIASIINEVKNRQYSRSFSKPDVAISGGLDATALINEFRKVVHEQKTRKCDCKIGRVDRSERYPTDCHEIQMQGFNVSGIYKIKPDDMEPFYVLCDLTTGGGGWTVFQNRFDGSQDFFKGWMDYKYGFGNLAGEFWLGLEKVSYLTNQKLYELRVEIEAQHSLEAYAGYSVFTVGPEYEGFRISTLGTFYGTAGDSLCYHAGQKFSTPDVDNDEWKDGACAVEHGGAWWYKECDKSNLNGKYSMTADENRGQSIYWISFKGPNYPLTKTKMMIRPLPASKPIDYESNRVIKSHQLPIIARKTSFKIYMLWYTYTHKKIVLLITTAE
ncbi:hypothetical protein K1T71_000225 [Dendrolimus kikuchii]|uniref:Uncharacterized protein n=1 Tax=Dendrolimus kikuchii TaxID=765133 RepID=A0ACC1DK68_9NEOP|nr:hypothetical protein K1T71_000225 [Dendrolimus kikuchii]